MVRYSLAHLTGMTLVVAATTVAWGSAHAAKVEGLYERGKTHSALFEMSPESGDVVGYAIANGSALGKKLASVCVPDMYCSVDKATSRPMNQGPAEKFSEQPSGWHEISKGGEVSMASDAFEGMAQADTRFGKLAVNQDSVLTFKGKPVSPKVEGNVSLTILDVQQIGKDDVALVRIAGGAACPALFHFVALNAQGIRVSPEFGTCSDYMRATVEGQTYKVQVRGVEAKPSKAIYRWNQGKFSKQE